MNTSNLNKLKGYRNYLGKTQEEMARDLNISKQSYNSKENKKTPFTDTEKVQIKKMLLPYFPTITLEELFF